jgi:hypothetical protein
MNITSEEKNKIMKYYNETKKVIDLLESKAILTSTEKNKLLIYTGRLEAFFLFDSIIK